MIPKNLYPSNKAAFSAYNRVESSQHLLVLKGWKRQKERRGTGMARRHSVKKIINDYCVLDTETTGLTPGSNEIIEIGMLRIRNGKIVSRYSQLIHPEQRIVPFITSLTGISNEMVAGMPSLEDVRKDVFDFIGDDVILGHNILFDLKFMNAGFQTEIVNDYMDTLQFARKLFPELSHHRLSDLSRYLHLSNNEHRALADCVTTYELYETIKQTMALRNVGVEDLWISLRKK